ncbi:uncharacterized protein LOC131144007 [Malania oleifera]|uniref:uncharacterized protein LOC131144007 n=1 Tax=Malania oleifera TaxID=397392 RepID=UPI0025AE6EFA|nr:uncharacterized protein LOC131144007 [Malania oleifera]
MQIRGSESDGAGSDSAVAGVVISGVPGVELIAAADEVEAGLGDEVVEEGEVEVTGDEEDVVDASFDEVAAEGGIGGRNDGGRYGVVYCSGGAIRWAAYIAIGGIAGVQRADLRNFRPFRRRYPPFYQRLTLIEEYQTSSSQGVDPMDTSSAPQSDDEDSEEGSDEGDEEEEGNEEEDGDEEEKGEEEAEEEEDDDVDN